MLKCSVIILCSLVATRDPLHLTQFSIVNIKMKNECSLTDILSVMMTVLSFHLAASLITMKRALSRIRAIKYLIIITIPVLFVSVRVQPCLSATLLSCCNLTVLLPVGDKIFNKSLGGRKPALKQTWCGSQVDHNITTYA